VHIRGVHKINLPPVRRARTNKSKPNRSSIESNLDDPNFYCESCTTKYATRSTFRIHIRQVHKMNLESLYKKGKVNTQPP
jgi:hypothetical protein